jgi:hypothetical protein
VSFTISLQICGLRRLTTNNDLDTSFRGNVPFLEVSDSYHRELGATEADVSGSPVEIEGVVEYKSLPSGLHNVSEDLVYVGGPIDRLLCANRLSLPRYFVHEQYAGISSFINQPADEAERNAQMFAVGVLVPLSFGRLGKSWRHAPRLKELAEWVRSLMARSTV